MEKSLRAEQPPDVRRRLFLRIASVAMAIFAVCALFAIVRTVRALHTGQTWTNYRGVTITHGDMHRAIGLSVLIGVVALVTFGLLVQQSRK